MLTLFRWLSHWPLWFLHVIGAALGWLSYWLSPSYRRRFDENVRQAGIAPKRARAAVAHAGRMVAELPFLWMRAAGVPLGKRVRWLDDGLTARAQSQGRGVVFLTPHIGCFEVAAQAYAEHFAERHGPITVLFRPARKPWLREVIDSSRARPGVATAPANLGGVRQMIRALRRGEAVGLLPDQVPPEDMGVWAPFFGRPAYTMTLAARLVQQTGAVPLLVWGERLPGGRGYDVHVRAFDEPLPADAGAQAESAAVVNRAMEKLILQCPGQYLWGYDRYKTPRNAPLGLAAQHDKD